MSGEGGRDRKGESGMVGGREGRGKGGSGKKLCLVREKGRGIKCQRKQCLRMKLFAESNGGSFEPGLCDNTKGGSFG